MKRFNPRLIRFGKTLSPTTFIVILIISLFCSSVSFAAGLMSPIGSSLPPLEIKEHHVRVVIEDGYAITHVEQVFFNPNNEDLEANYSFPIPEKAAVGEFTYWIDGKAVSGEVLEKKQARQIYQEEKQAGREAGITEQDEFKTFDIAVYPARAQQDVRIRLAYIQPAHVDTAIGRYVYPLEEGGVDEKKLSFWTYNKDVKERFSFNLTFRSSYPIDQFRLPQHPQAIINQISEKEWTVAFANDSTVNTTSGENETLNNEAHNNETHNDEEGTGYTGSKPTVVQTLDKDIVVYWRHQPNLPGTVDLITHREPGESRGTFMMTVTPGDDLNKITEGTDWIFVLDYSGSMQGKYQSMIEGVHKALNKLNANDRFRLYIFNDNASELTKGFVTALPENVSRWTTTLEQNSPGGSTNLYDGIQLGTRGLDSDRSSAIILVTDGVANVGVTEKKAFLTLMENNDVRLFTFVMGNSANRPLLESMAKISNGFAMNVSNSDDIVGQLMQATSKLSHQALHDVNVKFAGIKVKDLSPAKIASLYRGQQLIVFGHYWGDGEVKVTIDGKVSGQSKTYSTTFDFPKQSQVHPETERFWAFATIEDLQNKMDYFGKDADTEQAITDIAINYGLVTEYTSIIVMRDEQFAQRGIDRNNRDRVEKEEKARQQRAASAVRDMRVDNRNPMYNNNAPSHSGGGALGPWMILLLLPLLFSHKLVRAKPFTRQY